MTNNKWFDDHVIIDLGGFNNKEEKSKAEETLKNKLKEKLEEEFNSDSKRDD